MTTHTPYTYNYQIAIPEKGYSQVRLLHTLYHQDGSVSLVFGVHRPSGLNIPRLDLVTQSGETQFAERMDRSDIVHDLDLLPPEEKIQFIKKVRP